MYNANMPRKLLTFAAVTFAALLIFCGSGLAQLISGELVGTVLDASGAAVPRATVTAENQATGVKTATKTDTVGQYRLSNLPAGMYTITVMGTGFAQAVLKDVAVELNKTATANVNLQ